ncbi:hypothetical protein J132_04375 [Termitomyces sp. J132]|nr:hypothetical protein J132_04375 [Termitomyces sp. J132]
MALAEALRVGLTCDSDIRLHIESANKQVNESVGLAHNVPFTFVEGFTVYLQVHIFEKPAYTILLGRPFDTLIESNIQNLQDGSAIIIIRDPNTGRRTALPTIERKKNGEIVLTSYTVQNSGFSKDGLRDAYLQAFATSKGCEGKNEKTLSAYLNGQLSEIPRELEEASMGEAAQVFGKYKSVARKVKPVLGTSSEEFRIERHIIGDPLADMPQLSTNPPEFTPTGRYTAESKEIIDQAHDNDFLWPEEKKLVHHLMMLQNEAFAWDDSQRGRLKEEYFPPVVMPVIPHTPCVLKNIPISPGLHNKICKMIKQKIEAGVYEPSNSSYHHMQNVNCVLQQVKYAGNTFSEKKSVVCADKIVVVVVLSVDTSWMAVGFGIFEEHSTNPKQCTCAKLGSITLNKQEARFSQLKRELYGLMRALQANKYWLVGCRKLVVETDAKYLKGMLSNPGVGPNATIMRWIEDVLLYHFILRHVYVKGITISPYNSPANERIERPHWDVQQALFKACEDHTKWFWFFFHVMWSDYIIICKQFGCSPSFIVTEAHPIIRLDLAEATWLVELPEGSLSIEELIGHWAWALAKHSQHVEEMRE